MRVVSHCQALPPKIESQLLGGVPSNLASAHTYQSAFGLLALLRLSLNQGCWSEVWESTWSIITRRPSSCARATSARKSSRVPNIGSTSR